MNLDAINKRVESFLFDDADPRSVAALRVWIAFVAAFVFYPRDQAALGAIVRSDWSVALYDRLFLTHAYWGVCAVLLLLFAVGPRTRVAGLLAAGLLAPCIPVLGRLPGRYIIWFALAACALLRSNRTVWGRPSAGPAGPMWPIRLIQLQLSTLYLVNAIAKSSWGYLNGGVLAAMSQQLPNFHLDLTDGVLPIAGVEVPLAVAAVGSATVEYALAFGFWVPRLRWPAAALGIAFHLGLAFVVTIGRLDIVAMALYASFLLPWKHARVEETR